MNARVGVYGESRVGSKGRRFFLRTRKFRFVSKRELLEVGK